MFYSKERGKTLIEVTLVIAIICLISGVVFYTWNTMSLKGQTNVLSQRIISIKNARQINMSGLQHKPMKRTEIGPYNTLFEIENGIGLVNKDWFWIITTLGNKHLCELLLESDLGALKKDDNCDNNEAVFYFEKFPGFAQGNPDRNLQPKECPPNTICDENFNPIGCVPGYFLHNGACIQCPTNSINCQSAGFECKEGYYKDGIRCRSCGANVLSCDEDGNPTECEDGYYLSGNLCIACPTTGVATCDDDGFTCLAGYYKNGNSCTSCGTGVAICDEDGNPTECEDGYYLSGNSCVQCPTTGVDTCDTNGFTCLAGYYKNGNTCVFCAQFDQYSIGGSVTACSVCEIGKKANDQHSACVNCQVGEKCACDAGLLWNGTACACPENSSTNVVEGNQIANTVCYCNEGYELNEDKTGCFLDMCQNFTPSTCILSCQTKDGVQEYEYATSGTSCKTNSSFGTDNGFCDGQGNCQPNLCETGCSYNYDCNSGEYCSFDPEDYVSNAPQMCSGQCKAVECTEVVKNNAIKTDITYDTAYNFCSALKRNGIVSDYWGYTPAGYTYWFNNGNMGPLNSSQYTGIQIFAGGGGGLSGQNAVGYDFRNKKYSVNCPMEMACPTSGCPENSSTNVVEGNQIGNTACYCNEGYEQNEDSTGCVEVSLCGNNVCCQEMLDTGYLLLNAESQTEEGFSFNDNQINYKGDMVVSQNMDLSDCDLIIDGGLSVSANTFKVKNLSATNQNGSGITISDSSYVTVSEDITGISVGNTDHNAAIDIGGGHLSAKNVIGKITAHAKYNSGIDVLYGTLIAENNITGESIGDENTTSNRGISCAGTCTAGNEVYGKAESNSSDGYLDGVWAWNLTAETVKGEGIGSSKPSGVSVVESWKVKKVIGSTTTDIPNAQSYGVRIAGSNTAKITGTSVSGTAECSGNKCHAFGVFFQSSTTSNVDQIIGKATSQAYTQGVALALNNAILNSTNIEGYAHLNSCTDSYCGIYGIRNEGTINATTAFGQATSDAGTGDFTLLSQGIKNYPNAVLNVDSATSIP